MKPREFKITGFELIEKKVKSVKNTAPYVYIPTSWKDKRIAIIRLE